MCVALIIEISKRRTLNNHECLPKPHETKWRTNQTQPNDHSQRQTSKYRSVKMLGYEKQIVHHKWVTTQGVLHLDVCRLCVQLGRVRFRYVVSPAANRHITCCSVHRDFVRITYIGVLARRIVRSKHVKTAFCFTQNRTYRGYRVRYL